jgi:histone H3/H4
MVMAKKTAVATPAPKLSISDKLKVVATSSAKVTKPTLSGVADLVDKVADMKKQVADMEVLYKLLSAELSEKAFQIYDSVREKNYSSSIFAEGKTSNGLMVVYSDKFSALPVELEADLRKKDSKYDDHFVEVRDLKVKKDAGKTISDETIEKLMKALGEDEFAKIFEVNIAIGAVKGMAEKLNELPEEIKDLLKQAAPSVRNVTVDGKVC